MSDNNTTTETKEENKTETISNNNEEKPKIEDVKEENTKIDENNNNNTNNVPLTKEQINERGRLTIEEKDFVRAQANLGKGNRKGSIAMRLNQLDYVDTIGEKDCKADSVVYIKDCKGGAYTIEAYSAKVLIEGCKAGTKVIINGKVLSQMVEIWNCDDVYVEINTNVKTLQIDQNENVNMVYGKKEDFHQVIWAGCNKSSLKFGDFDQSIIFDFDTLKKENENLRKDIDQFIVRIINDDLLQEKLVRLDNGYPTTERERNEFDKMQKKNDQAYLQKVREMVKENPSLLKGLKKTNKNTTKVNKSKKIGRNDPCPCKSGKKYKVCCANKTPNNNNNNK